MVDEPPDRKIYHISHKDNLSSIIAAGRLLSDRLILKRGGPAAMIGMSAINKRRLEELHVTCHPGTYVGDYVPFYFCPRSIMLYLIHMANHPELTYRGGQGPILHFEFDLREVVRWADGENRKWAFSFSNAGAYYVRFGSNPADFTQLDWTAIDATDFRDADVKEGKQAEMLIHRRVPWEMVERIGACTPAARAAAERIIDDSGVAHRPPVVVKPAWYF